MRNLSEATKRNIAINYYKDLGMVLADNNEVHFQGGVAGLHRGILMDGDKVEVIFDPSDKISKETLKKKFGDRYEHRNQPRS